jgi:hypothetical protein
MTKCPDHTYISFDCPSPSGFLSCPACDGHGFLRLGDFAHREFPRCAICHGVGQLYLKELPPPVEAD